MRLELFRMPSGDVMQAFNPVQWFVRSAGQLGIININLGRTAAPELEERIVQRVGSYGRQLGRISDALEVLVSRLDEAGLTQDQHRAIAEFQLLSAEIRRVKEAWPTEA